MIDTMNFHVSTVANGTNAAKFRSHGRQKPQRVRVDHFPLGVEASPVAGLYPESLESLEHHPAGRSDMDEAV